MGWAWSQNLVWSESLNLLLWLTYDCCKDISNLRVPVFLNMNMPGPNMNFKIKPLFACSQKPFNILKLILCCRNHAGFSADIEVQLWFGWSSSARLLVHHKVWAPEQGWGGRAFPNLTGAHSQIFLSTSVLNTWLQHFPLPAGAMGRTRNLLKSLSCSSLWQSK